MGALAIFLLIAVLVWWHVFRPIRKERQWIAEEDARLRAELGEEAYAQLREKQRRGY